MLDVKIHERGINVTLKLQSDPQQVLLLMDTLKNKKNFYNRVSQQFPEKYYNNFDSFESNWADRIDNKIYQLKLVDNKKKEYYPDQAERLNAFGFNKFRNWTCNAGFQSCIVREPGGEVKEVIVVMISPRFNR